MKSRHVLKIVAAISVLLFSVPTVAQTIRYVDPGGLDAGDCSVPDDPCATVSYAVSQTSDGDTVEIAAGTYTESDGVIVNTRITLRGTGRELPDATIIQAHEQPNQASERVLTLYTEQAVITDMIIRHGVADDFGSPRGGGLYGPEVELTLDNVAFVDNWAGTGGGLYLGNSNGMLQAVSIEHCLFENNVADSQGGGLYAGWLQGDRLEIVNTRFVANQTEFGLGGGMMSFQSNFRISDSSFESNQAAANGGGMRISWGIAELVNVDFIENQALDTDGGAIFASNNQLRIENTRFLNNSAVRSGGGLVLSGMEEALMVNVLFAGNHAPGESPGTDGGGAINNATGDLTLVNATFHGNSGSSGGALNNFSGAVTLLNTLFWANVGTLEGDDIHAHWLSDLTAMSYGLYTGDVSGSGTFTCSQCITGQDPLLTDPGAGDFNPQPSSPAVNTGDPMTDPMLFPTNSFGESVDLEGKVRYYPDESSIDIGALEWQPDDRIFADRFQQ